MNKSELIADVATKAEITKKDADAAVNAVIEAITESLKKGDKVQPLRFVSAAPALAVTPEPIRKSRFLPPRHLLLKPARL